MAPLHVATLTVQRELPKKYTRPFPPPNYSTDSAWLECSVKIRSKNSLSWAGSKVEGMMTYCPMLSANLSNTLLLLTKTQEAAFSWILWQRYFLFSSTYEQTVIIIRHSPTMCVTSSLKLGEILLGALLPGGLVCVIWFKKWILLGALPPGGLVYVTSVCDVI